MMRKFYIGAMTGVWAYIAVKMLGMPWDVQVVMLIVSTLVVDGLLEAVWRE